MFDTTQDRMDDATAADVRSTKRYTIQKLGRRRNWDVVDRETGDVVEGGFFAREAAQTSCDGYNAKVKNETTFVAVGPFAWGRSTKSIEDAVRIMKTQIPRSYLSKGKHKFPVYKITGEFICVNGMGSIEYKGEIEQVHEGFIVAR